MKKRIAAVMIGFVLIAITILSQLILARCRYHRYLVHAANDNLPSKSAVIYINEVKSDVYGKILTFGELPKSCDPIYSLEIPFISLLEEIGADISWENDYKAEIELEGKIFNLNLDLPYPSLTESVSNENLIYDLYGARTVIKSQKRELILDAAHVSYVLYDMSFQGFIIDFDYEKGYIYYEINSK